VGILIVTRLKEEADTIRDTINKIADRTVAIVHHSDNRATPDDLHQSDVVIVTHQAFLNAKRSFKEQLRTPWERLVSWRGGLRPLTIIDEALANVVDESNATAENLAFVIGHIPFAVRTALPEQVATLEQMHRVLLDYVDEDARKLQLDAYASPLGSGNFGLSIASPRLRAKTSSKARTSALITARATLR
jgi:hypothetical protein